MLLQFVLTAYLKLTYQKKSGDHLPYKIIVRY